MTQTAIALSRKYRPKNFQDGFVGQEYVSKMISYALNSNKLGNSILLSGERGCGKTSTARIIAKGLNCESSNKAEPCGTCAYCTDELMLILEIDAATNRGIDEVRSLKDSIRYATPPGKYKVYIIDEVHMMTKESFNALLKTLEEPPENVMFVLCTTDPEKLPPTIISRMKHFKFGKVSIDKIVEHLKYVLQEEGISNYTNEALEVIAQQANGGMRDSLTILEQCLLLNDDLTAENVFQVIGKVDTTSYLEVLLAINENNLEKALSKVRSLLNSGVQTKYFYQDFIDSITNLVIKKLYTQQEKELASRLTFTNPQYLSMLNILQQDMKMSFVELSVIKIFNLDFVQHIKPSETVTQNQPSVPQTVQPTVSQPIQETVAVQEVEKPLVQISFLAKKVFETYQ